MSSNAAFPQQLDSFPSALANIGNAVIVATEEGRIVSLNSVARVLTGWGSDDPAGLPLTDLFRVVNEQTRLPIPDPVTQVLAEEEGGVDQGNPVLLLARDGTERPIEHTGVPLRDTTGSLAGVVLVFRDLSERRQAERAAADARAYAEAVRDSALDPIITIDHEGKILDFNRAAERTFGYQRDQVLGQVMRELIVPPSLRQVSRRAIHHYLATGEGPIIGKSFETAAMRADGTKFPIELAIHVVPSARPPIFTACLRDLTERKRHQLEVAVHRAVTVALDEAASVKEAASRILQAICQHLKWDFSSLFLVDRPLGVLSCVETWTSPQVVLAEFPDLTARSSYRRGEGLLGRAWEKRQPVWLADFSREPSFPRMPAAARDGLHGAFAFPLIIDGEVSGVLEFFSRDIRAPDEGLLELFVNLGDQIGQYIRRKQAELVLQQALAEAEQATRAKSDFLANMSHEVRTPMSAIVGFADILLDPQLTPEETVDAVQAIRRNGAHLLQIINDILDLSKIEAGKLDLHWQPYSPWQIVQEAVSSLRVLADERGLQLDVQAVGRLPLTCMTDPARVRQILSNGLSNAIKFTDSGRRVSVRLSAQRTPARLSFEVEDEGIGMSPDQLARLFKPFEQADTSSTRKYGGTGLGLSISKRLSEALGGEIQVRSSPGKGTTFVFLLPVQDIAESEWADASRFDAAVAFEEPQEGTELMQGLIGKVLLAEDSRFIQVMMTYHLNRAGLQVEIADNGRLAVQKALEGGYDVILMDMQMPELDGASATSALRQSGYQGPIIALTAHAMQGDRERFLACGLTDYLTKPVSVEKLLTTIARYLPEGRSPQSPAAASLDPKRESRTRIVPLAREPDRFQSHIQEYAHDLTRQIQAMRLALEAGDLALLSSLAHQIKGSAGMYGMPAVGETAGLVEEAVRENQDRSLVLELLQELKAAVSPPKPGGEPAP